MRAIVRVLVREFGGSSCNLIFRICTIPWGGIGTAASMVLSWKSSLVWKIACLYRVSILVGKWRTTVVPRCKITCDMSYNTLMVVQHTHTKVRIVLRPLKFVQHSCQSTQCCAALCECSWDPMQQFESSSIASEFWTWSKVRGDLMRPFYRMKQMWCIVQRKRQDVQIEAVGSQLWKGLDRRKYNVDETRSMTILNTKCLWNFVTFIHVMCKILHIANF